MNLAGDAAKRSGEGAQWHGARLPTFSGPDGAARYKRRKT
jgi:hypothetical protein